MLPTDPARPLTVLLIAVATAASLAMAPALPGTDPLEEEASDSETGQVEPGEELEPELYEACDELDGVTTITPADGFDEEITTPVGALDTGSEFGVGEVTELGYFQLDLAGHEVGTSARLTMTLSWDTPGELGDYDLIIDGSNEYSLAAPEVHTRTLGHCGLVDLAVDVFIGTPLDTVTLQVTAKEL